MTDAIQMRKWMILALIVPLAIILGVLLSSPLDVSTIGFVGLLLGVGLLPVILKWHHTLLVFTWNATINVFFLPGKPDLWILTAALSLFFLFWQRTITRTRKLVVVPFLCWPMLVLGLVVVGTAITRRIVGTEAGYDNETRRYFFVIAALLGFFAISFQSIPKKRAMLYAGLFFLSGTVAALSDIVFLAGPKFYFLYYLLPAGLAGLQATHEFTVGSVFRMEGVAWASVAFCCFLLLRYGAKGLLDMRFPWRMMVFLLAVALGLFGGFRSRLFLIGLLFIVQFCLEGLWRTRWLPILIALGILLSCAVLPFTKQLPQPFQRALSFLPVDVDPVVKRDAEESSIWRIEMWRVLLPEVPKYLWLGKGYTYSATEQYLNQFAIKRGWLKTYDSSILAGEYHNGSLSLLVPFGLWGFIAFIWLVAAGWRAMYCNYRYGDKDLQGVNTFLLTFYSVRTIFFFAVYGAVHTELMLFTGVLGLSIAINGGVRQKNSEKENKGTSNRDLPQSFRRAVITN